MYFVCISNALLLWLSGEVARDDKFALSLQGQGYQGGVVTVLVNRPTIAPVSCQQVKTFLLAWTNPALKVRGLPEAQLAVTCGSGLCSCQKGLHVCPWVAY
jgi:hypothetical protein